MSGSVSLSETKHINELVELYLKERTYVSLFRKQILNAFEESQELQKHIHSVKSRLKDPEHLRDKLLRKFKECKQENRPFDINAGNLLTRINDLAGIRLLHLHTTQIQIINDVMTGILQEVGIEIIEGPFARTWDDESRAFFSKIGIETQASPTMYTSVHYVVASNSRRIVTCEIQVRTLMEEVWGEVDHAINYPQKNESVPCREQILALARSTSSATRLVDAIFATVADIELRKTSDLPSKKTRRQAAKTAGRPSGQKKSAK